MTLQVSRGGLWLQSASPGTSMNVSLGDPSDYWWSWVFKFLFFFLSFLLGVFYCPSYAIYFGNWFAISVYAGKILPGQPI